MSDKLNLYPGAVGKLNNFNEPWVLIVLCKSRKGATPAAPQALRHPANKRWHTHRKGRCTKGIFKNACCHNNAINAGFSDLPAGAEPEHHLLHGIPGEALASEASELGQMSWPSQFIAASSTAAEGSLPYNDIQWF